MTVDPSNEEPAPPEREAVHGVPVTWSRGQRVLHPSRAELPAIVRTLRDDDGFNMCLDVTGVDYLTFDADRGLPEGAEPERFEVARVIGRLLRAVGDPAGAVDYLKRAWILEPADGLTVAELVLALHDLNRRDEAVQVMLASLDAGLEQTGFVANLIAGD